MWLVGWLVGLVGEKLMTLTLSMVAGDLELGDKNMSQIESPGTYFF